MDSKICPGCTHRKHAGLCGVWNVVNASKGGPGFCSCTLRLCQTPKERAEEDEVVEKGRGNRWP